MRESLFIKKNLARWKSYEQEVSQDPDEMAERFTTIVDDLAYSKTFYSYSKTTQYLNGLAAGMYQSIYSTPIKEPGRFKKLLMYQVPLIVAKYKKVFLFAALLFMSICMLSAFSASVDDTFVRGVLGDNYVNMTEENIAKGDPFNVYKDSNELMMWVQIANNNLNVALSSFVMGVLLGLGSLYILVNNAFMVGAFQYFFFAKGLGMASVLVIWIHGTLEISAIIISSAAGLILGYNLLFPGTLKRVEALKRAAFEGLKIMFTIIPIITLAAFLEGFVTRHTEMPVFLSTSILAISFVIIIGYYVIWPIQLVRKGFSLDEKGRVLFPKN
ncbi:hypothetical protein COR50_04040 [Chitinophaga caeni]|uniref:Stage II sporulation protein M n=1 Tax=Chitinophaga caeni TaxID=2029983 RepID=A0A291QR68_9BACT|nr:stage II sporulation protein M [Chitinophaga caeni]ATL46411.1 hypothetical protein COR50_04040 [Chitinophaga caeni]